MQQEIFQVDAFTGQLFAGNPAAVCPLEEWLPDGVMQQIAAENALSETAFVCRENGAWRIRWFTPTREVELCGHATLASAYVLTRVLQVPETELQLDSASGVLTVRVLGDGRLELDFPARPGHPYTDGGRVHAALGAAPLALYRTDNPDPESDKIMAVFESAAEVHSLQPDMAALKQLPGQGVVVTAPGDDCDFVSRYFVPKVGVDEDPVTGSAHCTLTPYWAQRLAKNALQARQISARGGVLECTLEGNRVRLAGRAVLYLTGRIALPGSNDS